MQHTGFAYKIISLLGMVVVLAIAWGMDQFLESQRKYAAASFEYLQHFLLPSIVTMLVLMALWFGLGWLALFKSGYSRLIWLTFLVVGIFFGLGYYVQALDILSPLRNVFRLVFQVSRLDMMRPTAMYIAVLGLLHIALQSRFTHPRSRSGD